MGVSHLSGRSAAGCWPRRPWPGPGSCCWCRGGGWGGGGSARAGAGRQGRAAAPRWQRSRGPAPCPARCPHTHWGAPSSEVSSTGTPCPLPFPLYDNLKDWLKTLFSVPYCVQYYPKNTLRKLAGRIRRKCPWWRPRAWSGRCQGRLGGWGWAGSRTQSPGPIRGQYSHHAWRVLNLKCLTQERDHQHPASFTWWS